MNLQKNDIVVSQESLENVPTGTKMLVAKNGKRKIEFHYFCNNLETLQTIDIAKDEHLESKIQRTQPQQLPDCLQGWSIKSDNQTANDNGISFKTVFAYNKKPVIEWQNDSFGGVDRVFPSSGVNRKYIDNFKQSMTDFLSSCEDYKDKVRRMDLSDMLLAFYDYKQHPYKNLISLSDYMSKSAEGF